MQGLTWICPCGSCATGDLNCICGYRNSAGQFDAGGALRNSLLGQSSHSQHWDLVKRWSSMNKTSGIEHDDLTDLGKAVFFKMAACWDPDACCNSYKKCKPEPTCLWQSKMSSELNFQDLITGVNVF